jgi:hypothetical protein
MPVTTRVVASDMLEDLERKNSFVESVQAFVYLIKTNPVRSLFYIGSVPFGILWVRHNSRPTAFALQAYLITVFVFAYEPFRNEKQNVKKRWFWKAILIGGILMHPALMLALWNLDGAHPSLVTGGGGVFGVTFLVAVLESIMIGSIVNRYRPKDEETGASSPE